MIRLAALLNKLVHLSKFIYAANSAAFEDFFQLQQGRLLSLPPERRADFAQQLLQEPMFVQFLENRIEQNLKRWYYQVPESIREDAATEIFNSVVDNLPRTVGMYNGKGSLIGWMLQQIKLNSMGKMAKEVNGRPYSYDNTNNWNNMPSNAGGVPEIPGSEFSEFIQPMRSEDMYWEQKERLEAIERKLREILRKPLQTSRERESVDALWKLREETKARLEAYLNPQADTPRTSTPRERSEVDLTNNLSREDISMQSRKNIPFSELSNIMSEMTRLPQHLVKDGVNGFYPTSSFFAQPRGANISRESRQMMSKILMESMMDLRRHISVMNSKNQAGQRQRINVTQIKPLLIDIVIKRMAEQQIHPEIQKDMVEHINRITDRELVDRTQDLDEMMRLAYYKWIKDNNFPNTNWDDLSDEQRKFIADEVRGNMEYDRGGTMYVRKDFSGGGYQSSKANSSGVDVVPRATKGLPDDIQRQLMLQEMLNLSQGKRGHGVGATLPADSPYFNAQKGKPLPPPPPEDKFYSPNVNQNYVTNAHSEMNMIRKGMQALITSAEWYDRNQMYQKADDTHKLIRMASID